MTELRLPEAWVEFEGIEILDPDGWREDGKSYDEPISHAEFLERAYRSTIRIQTEKLRIPETRWDRG